LRADITKRHVVGQPPIRVPTRQYSALIHMQGRLRGTAGDAELCHSVITASAEIRGAVWSVTTKEETMSAQVLWMNVPLMVLVFGLMVGIPLWMVLRRPDRYPAETRTVPAYIVQRPSRGRAWGAR
jgi:hypothetical protein